MKSKIILIVFFAFMIGLAFVLKMNKKPKFAPQPSIKQPVQQPVSVLSSSQPSSSQLVVQQQVQPTNQINQTNQTTNQVLQLQDLTVEKENKKDKEKKEETKVKKIKSEEDVFKKFKAKGESKSGTKIDYLPPPPPLQPSPSQQVDIQVYGIIKKDNKLKVITNLGIFEEKQKITDDEVIEEIQLNRIKTNKRIIIY